MTAYQERNSRRTPEYRAWDNMIQRCYNPNYIRSQNYMGRGIKVCQRWLDSYDNFIEDMGERPEGRYSLDRIDNNKDYSKENCRWATYTQQINNRRLFKKSNQIYPGVYKRKDDFRVSVFINGKTVHCGIYKSLDEAISAVFFYKFEYYGDKPW